MYFLKGKAGNTQQLNGKEPGGKGVLFPQFFILNTQHNARYTVASLNKFYLVMNDYDLFSFVTSQMMFKEKWNKEVEWELSGNSRQAFNCLGFNYQLKNISLDFWGIVGG